MWTTIGAVAKLIAMIFSSLIAHDKQRRQENKAVRKELADAIKKRDPSAMTRAMDRARR